MIVNFLSYYLRELINTILLIIVFVTIIYIFSNALENPRSDINKLKDIIISTIDNDYFNYYRNKQHYLFRINNNLNNYNNIKELNDKLQSDIDNINGEIKNLQNDIVTANNNKDERKKTLDSLLFNFQNIFNEQPQ